jgi:hypothetical protein
MFEAETRNSSGNRCLFSIPALFEHLERAKKKRRSDLEGGKDESEHLKIDKRSGCEEFE